MSRLLFIAAMFLPLETAAEWKAPPNPDPEAILDEAREDTRAGRYEDALAKRLWFHHHALEYQPSLYGVRQSFEDWHKLGKAYPPALAKLKESRDEAVKQVVEGKDDVRPVFHDLCSINEQLGDEEKTVATFERLDKSAPEKARRVYDEAQPALVKAKKFAICGKYLKPKKSYADMVELHGLDIEFAEMQTSLAEKSLNHELAEKIFLERSGTLIALLVLNDRKPTAETIAKNAMNESKHPNRDAVIREALAGNLPKIAWSDEKAATAKNDKPEADQ